MLPEDIYELVNAGDPRISPDGSRVAFVVTAVDREANEYRGAIWVAPLDGSAEPRQFTSGERRDTTPRWSPDGNWLAFASNRGDDEDADEPLRHPGRGRRGAQADRPEGERRGDRVVAGLEAHRVRRARPRRGLRGGGRQEARAAPLHARLPQARQRRLHRRPPEAPLRRRPRRRRAEAADERRLRARQPGLVARRQAHRVRRPARRALGRRARSTASTRSTSTARASRRR